MEFLRRALPAVIAAWVFLVLVPAHATVLTPASDDEVIEVLPAVSGSRGELAGLRRAIAANPHDAASAVSLARLYLNQARTAGDPRFAGQALAVLSPWPDPQAAPDDVLLMIATLQQYLHDFDSAAKNLERLVLRQPRNAQAWLTLATVRRVQGKYRDSDRACEAVASAGAIPYAQACKAENDSLRGDYAGARRTLMSILAARNLTAETRNWLLTTMAENEARAGMTTAAESAYRAALNAQADSYTAMSCADFLIQQGRYAEAKSTLAGQPRTDAVLLRLAIAGFAGKLPGSDADVQEVRQRMELANMRPDARTTHAREAAMFALWIDANPRQALELAREDVRHQRESLDLLVFARAAAAANDDGAKREVTSLASDIGMRDTRLDAHR